MNNLVKESKIKPVKWPTQNYRWWWMRYKSRPREDWQVVLVEPVEVWGDLWLRSHDGTTWIVRANATKWQATFLPADGPMELEVENEQR